MPKDTEFLSKTVKYLPHLMEIMSKVVIYDCNYISFMMNDKVPQLIHW